MADNESYWSEKRLTRRSALRTAAVAGGSVAALSLVGCGSNDKAGSTDTSTKQPAATIADSTKGKPGGNFKFMLAAYPAGFNNVTSSLTVYTSTGLVYDSLLSHAWGQESVDIFDYFNLEPSLARALPEQPDETTLVFKLRNDVKFHNGRAMTAEDVGYSFDKYMNDDKSLWRSRWRNWVDSVSTPDSQTVTIKTKFPFADAIVAMGGNTDGYVMAKEFQESNDSISKMMGTGPFMYVDSLAPVSISYKKNPNYHLKPYPYFDTVEAFATTDTVKRIADFTSRQVHLPWLVYAQDREEMKKGRPDAVVQTWESWSPSLGMRCDKPPFNDKRLRQALSMTIDRKKLRDAVTLGEGRPDQAFQMMYQKVLGNRDPKDLPNGLGKYWEYNPTEAKKLLSAAGIDKIFEANYYHWDPSVVGQWYVDLATLTQATWKDLGIVNARDLPLTGAQTSTTTQIGNYEGMSQTPTSGMGGAPTFTIGIKDKVYWGPSDEHAPQNTSYIKNPDLNTMAEKQIRQLKLEDRKATYRQMETIMAEEQYVILWSSTTQNYLWDPSLRNIKVSPEQGSRHYSMKWWFA